MTIKATMENLKQLIPDSEIREAFLARDDIKTLPSDEQERRWRNHLEGVNRFREMLCGTTCHLIP